MLVVGSACAAIRVARGLSGHSYTMPTPGEVSERSKERAWKARNRVFPGSRVQIPLSPLIPIRKGPHVCGPFRMQG